MAYQTILTSGMTTLLTYMQTTYKYMAFGNGSWGGSEAIPLNTTKLRHEVFRTNIQNAYISGNTITFYAAFVGSNLLDAGNYNLTELAVVNTSAYSSSQKMLAMKVFSNITFAPIDSKVVKVICTLQYTNS